MKRLTSLLFALTKWTVLCRIVSGTTEDTTACDSCMKSGNYWCHSSKLFRLICLCCAYYANFYYAASMFAETGCYHSSDCPSYASRWCFNGTVDECTTPPGDGIKYVYF